MRYLNCQKKNMWIGFVLIFKQLFRNLFKHFIGYLIELLSLMSKKTSEILLFFFEYSINNFGENRLKLTFHLSKHLCFISYNRLVFIQKIIDKKKLLYRLGLQSRNSCLPSKALTMNSVLNLIKRFEDKKAFKKNR